MGRTCLGWPWLNRLCVEQAVEQAAGQAMEQASWPASPTKHGHGRDTEAVLAICPPGLCQDDTTRHYLSIFPPPRFFLPVNLQSDLFKPLLISSSTTCLTLSLTTTLEDPPFPPPPLPSTAAPPIKTRSTAHPVFHQTKHSSVHPPRQGQFIHPSLTQVVA